VLHGSTDYLPAGFGSFGSRSTVMGGCAIVLAANALMERFRAAAAKRLGVVVDDVKVGEGVATARDGRKLAVAELADERLMADGVFSNDNATYTYGTAIAHVAVDPKTGK